MSLHRANGTCSNSIAKGLDNAEIAGLLRLSEKTVRNHITRIFDKIRVKHRYQAIVMAREAGLGGAASPPVGAEAGHLSRAPGANPNSAPGHRPQYSGPRSPHNIGTACTRHAGTQITVKRNRVKRAVG